jgi:death-on-curing protein
VRPPKWLRKDTVIAVHQKTLREQGGRQGIRDEGLLQSALARPLNVYEYIQNPTLFQLAAAYGFGIASNHPFIDGNKRVAFYASVGFLRINGIYLEAAEAEAALTFLSLAAGDLGEEELSAWLRDNSQTPKTS